MNRNVVPESTSESAQTAPPRERTHCSTIARPSPVDGSARPVSAPRTHSSKIRGMSVRLQLFTVPGQVYYAATRKLVLSGADGIVFVADSQAGRGDVNQESLDDLHSNLAEHNRAPLTTHLEVETYTFSALPAEDRARWGDDVVRMVEAELRWAEGALGAAGVTTT